MFAQMMGMLDDPFLAVGRWMGRQGGREGVKYENPEQMVAALRNPATEVEAVARMHKMHYGSFYNKESRTAFSGLAERELLMKGKGFGGAVFGRPMKGFSVGMSHFKGMMPFAAIQGVAGFAFAEKGHRVSGGVGGISRGLGYALGDLIGTTFGGPVAGFALGSLGEMVGGKVGEATQMFNDFAKNTKHINMGGNYEDTKVAFTMRQRAAQEMGSSVMNARSWLGKEAALMHQ